MTFSFARIALGFRCSRNFVGFGTAILLGLTFAAAPGCREQEEITSRTEPHIEGMFAVPRSSAPEPQKPVSGVPGRLVGAALEHNDVTWFFKVLGPDEAVAKEVPKIKNLLASVRFEADEPRWDAPAGWRVGPDKPGRIATLLLNDATPPLELAISPLAGNQNMADNVNRWRGQVGLPKVSADEALKSVQTVATAGGQAHYVELQGTYAPEAAVMPPFAQASADEKPAAAKTLPPGHPLLRDSHAAMPPAAATPSATPDGRIKFTAPAGWEPGAPSGFVLSAFAVKEAGEELRITVSEAKGSLVDNINRWRAQELQLPPIDEAQAKESMTLLKLDGRDADYVELLGSANPGPQKAIFGVIIRQDDGETSWFIKLKGDAPLAQRRREQFSQFLSSLRFAQPAKAQ